MNHQWIFKTKPTGRIEKSHFEYLGAPIPEPALGQILIRNIYLSMDPAIRTWVAGDGYIAGVKPGAVMRGRTIGVVEKSRMPGVSEGSIVSGMLGWQEYALSSGNDLDGGALRKIPSDPEVPLTDYFSLYGIVGYTAYFGVMDICRPKMNDTLVVSAAAGAVGTLVGQIAKIKGCRVIGLAGTDEKCALLVDEFGFDGAINYKRGRVAQELKALCPKGIDIYFENVGGEIFDIVLEQMNWHGRVAICGLISQYNMPGVVTGTSRLMDVLMKRIRIEGFICRDYLDRAGEADAAMKAWVAAGKLKHKIHLIKGLENAPETVNMLFDGKNIGKLILQISKDPLNQFGLEALPGSC